MIWWVEYIQHAPRIERFADVSSRPHIISWGDACGENRLVSVVLVVENRMWWTVWYPPEEVVETFIPRKDCQIQMLEMLAIALAIGTFQDCLKGSLWNCFTDNDSVLGTILSGDVGMSA